MDSRLAIILLMASIVAVASGLSSLYRDENPFKALTKIACYHRTSYSGCQTCCGNIDQTFDYKGQMRGEGPCYCSGTTRSYTRPSVVPKPSCKHITSGPSDCNLCCRHIAKNGLVGEDGVCGCK